MRRMRLSGIAGIALMMGAAARAAEDDALQKAAQQYFKPVPSMVPAEQGNPVAREKIDLGRMLFFDPRTSPAAS